TSPNTTTSGALDGNTNHTAITYIITSADIAGFSIAAGATFWIRWLDFDASGSDDGLAVDDFSIWGNGPGALAIDDVTHTEGSGTNTTYTFTVTRSGGTSGAVAVNWAISFPGGAGIADASDFTGA